MYALVDVPSFTDLDRVLRGLMRSAPPVKTERWQGVAVNTDTRELHNVCYEVDLNGVENIPYWGKDCRPNLPWADDHFLERVGGEPLNPGVQWAKWPWGHSANKFRGPDEFGPQMAPQDWAYLAGMIDGEGTIYWQPKKFPSFQGVVRVYQKERVVLDYLHGLFKVGDVHFIDGGIKTLGEKEYHNTGHQWGIGSALEVRWLLDGCLPYLRVKRQHATWCLDHIEKCLAVEKSGEGRTIKKVWGRDWPPRFNHTYMRRLWPKKLDGGSEFRGHGHEYGDLNSLVELLAKEPHTRQAWIPLFHPEDTGIGDGGRKMCSLGYQLMVRDQRLHMYYPLRSCDLIRHWRDDCYLAIRMLLWVLDRCREINSDRWGAIKPGTLAMHMTSLHVFESDVANL